MPAVDLDKYAVFDRQGTLIELPPGVLGALFMRPDGTYFIKTKED